MENAEVANLLLQFWFMLVLIQFLSSGKLNDAECESESTLLET